MKLRIGVRGVSRIAALGVVAGCLLTAAQGFAQEKPLVPPGVTKGTVELSNNLIDINIGELNSSTWYYEYASGQRGESCYHEHYAIYTPETGILESDDYTVATPFPAHAGGSGSVECKTRSGNFEVTRRVTVPDNPGASPGDPAFLEIKYWVKNIGGSAYDDVRFFQAIDFDIPETGPEMDNNFGEYEAATDYLRIRHNSYFRNGMSSVPASSRHGLDFWSTQIYDDWDDGDLNNNNSSGPIDCGMAKQFNLGRLNPGQTSDPITLKIWFGDPTAEQQPQIVNAEPDGANLYRHHLVDADENPDYPDKTVYRRAEHILLNVELNDDYDPQTYFIQIIAQPQDHNGSNQGDAYTWTGQPSGSPMGGNWRQWKILVDANAPVGYYSLKCRVAKNDGNRTVNYPPDYDLGQAIVLFNPWPNQDNNGIYDAMVFSPAYALNSAQLSQYMSNHDRFRDSDAGNWQLGPKGDAVLAALYYLSDLSPEERRNAAKCANLLAEITRDGTDSGTPSDTWRYSDILSDRDDYGMMVGCWDPRLYTMQSLQRVAPLLNYDVSRIVRKWNEAGKNEIRYAQCFIFAGLLDGLLRATGVPARMITTTPSGGWNFHCWNEAWIPHQDQSGSWHAWSAVDGTYEVGPAPMESVRGDTGAPSGGDWDGICLFQYEVYDAPCGSFPPWYGQASSVVALGPNGSLPLLDAYLPGGSDVKGGTKGTKGVPDVRVEVTGSVEYSWGSEVVVTATVHNDSAAQKTVSWDFEAGDFSMMNGGAPAGTQPRLFEDDERANVAVPAGDSVSVEYRIPVADYLYAGDYLARLSVEAGGNSDSSDLSFGVLGLPVSITAPADVWIGNAFDFALTVSNHLATAVSNVEVSVLLPMNVNTPQAETVAVGTIPGHGSQQVVWSMNAVQSRSYSVVGQAVCPDIGLSAAEHNLNALQEGLIRTEVPAIQPVGVGATRDVTARIVNAGDTWVSNVTASVSLPDHVTLASGIADRNLHVAPRSGSNVTWSVHGDETGMYSLMVWTEDSGGAPSPRKESTASGLFAVTDFDHDVSVAISDDEVGSANPTQIELILTNHGNQQDEVVLLAACSNPNLAYSIYDGVTPIVNQNILVPANGTKTLTVEITPNGERGSLSFYIYSVLDPSAGAQTSLRVVFTGPTGEILDVTDDTTTSFNNWELDRSTGALIGNLVLMNNTDAPKTLEQLFWYVVEPGADIRLANPTGQTNGMDYVDITAQVEAALPSVGNGDLKLDPGEVVVISGIAFYTRDRSVPQGYVFAVIADPPVDGGGYHALDTNGDAVIDDFEILEGVDNWNSGKLDDFGLLKVIELWRAGGYEWDEAQGKFVPMN